MNKYTLLLEGNISIEFDESVKINGIPYRKSINHNLDDFIKDKLKFDSKFITIETETSKHLIVSSKIICIKLK